jgi:hypothetical protein
MLICPGYYLVNCPTTDETVSRLSSDYLTTTASNNNSEKLLFKMTSSDQLTGRPLLNGSRVGGAALTQAVLYFCSDIPGDVLLNGTTLDVSLDKYYC